MAHADCTCSCPLPTARCSLPRALSVRPSFMISILIAADLTSTTLLLFFASLTTLHVYRLPHPRFDHHPPLFLLKLLLLLLAAGALAPSWPFTSLFTSCRHIASHQKLLPPILPRVPFLGRLYFVFLSSSFSFPSHPRSSRWC